MLISQAYIYADKFWMRLLCDLARLENKEVPVIACAVSLDHKLIAISTSKTITNCDPTAHAEIELIRYLAKLYKNHRLPSGISIYVNLEPCFMCYGAMLNARLSRLVFGCKDSKFGVFSNYNGLTAFGTINHSVSWLGGVISLDCRLILREFFSLLR